MQWRLGRLRDWRFAVGVLAPTVVLLLVMAALATGFVMWSLAGVDSRSLHRETRLVARAVERQIEEIPRIQQTVALWDDAYIQTHTVGDQQWLDNNLGVWLHDFYGFDGVAILSDRDQPIYTMADGAAPAPALFADNQSSLQPLIDELRSNLARRSQHPRTSGPYPHVREIMRISGIPALVSIMPILPQSAAIDVTSGSEYLHVAVEYLDHAFAARLDRDYGIADAVVTTGIGAANEGGAYPLFGRNGKAIAFLSWQPGRPGMELLGQVGPVLGIAFLLVGIILVLLVRRLWQSSADLESERLSARHDASHDSLTGLANRVQYDTCLARDLGPGQPPLALLLLDLDRFKQVNDTLGHTVGDDVIRTVGQRLRELVGAGDVLARLGGDEFAVIHPCRDNGSDAMALGMTIVEIGRAHV